MIERLTGAVGKSAALATLCAGSMIALHLSVDEHDRQYMAVAECVTAYPERSDVVITAEYDMCSLRSILLLRESSR